MFNSYKQLFWEKEKGKNMKNYEKPMLVKTEQMSEGVYLASGQGCYTATAYIHQTQETGRHDYRIQVDGVHAADHTNDKQWLHISFNMPVRYSSSNGSLESGDGSSTLVICYGYHQNFSDDIGLGDLCVTADEGLAITSVSITD